MDLWIAVNPENASKMVLLIREFGFNVPELTESLFLEKGRIIRMGVEPVRIEILTEISGCEFAECYRQKVDATLDGIPVKIIGLADPGGRLRGAGPGGTAERSRQQRIDQPGGYTRDPTRRLDPDRKGAAPLPLRATG